MLYAIAVVLVLIADQWLKYWVTTNIVLETGEKTLIPGFLSLVNIHNDGAAYSMLSGGAFRWVFVAVAVCVVALVIYALARGLIARPLGRWAAVGVLAGAIGNCIDRIMQGYVVDMFRFDFLKNTFNIAGIFNIADVFITCCGILFIIHIITYKGNKDEAPASGRARRSRSKLPPEEEQPQPEAQPRPQPRMRQQPSYPAAEAGQGRPYAARRGAQRPEAARRQPEQPVNSQSPFAEWEAETPPSEDTRFRPMPGGAVNAPFTRTGTAAPPVTRQTPAEPTAAPVQPFTAGEKPQFRPAQPATRPVQPFTAGGNVQPAQRPVQPFTAGEPATRPIQPFTAGDTKFRPAQPATRPVQPFTAGGNVQPAQPVQRPVQPVQPPVQPAQPTPRPVQPARPIQSAPAPVETAQRPAQPVQPLAQPTAAPVPPVQPVQRPVQPAPAAEEFNLDDILAEFASK